jgi:hypothetical protein
MLTRIGAGFAGPWGGDAGQSSSVIKAARCSPTEMA